MILKTPDPIKQLEDTISWHEDQIELIKKAIVVLRGNAEEQGVQHESKKELLKQETPKIQWSKEIDNIFKTHDNLTIDGVIKKLIENGINESVATKSRNIVYGTIIRKCKEGKGKKLNKKNGVFSSIKK